MKFILDMFTYAKRLSYTRVLMKRVFMKILLKQIKLILKKIPKQVWCVCVCATPLVRCHLVDWIWACVSWYLVVAMGKPKPTSTLHQSKKKAMEVPRGIKGETPMKSKRDRERSWTLRALSKMGAPKVDSLVIQCAKQLIDSMCQFATTFFYRYRCCLMISEHTIDTIDA